MTSFIELTPNPILINEVLCRISDKSCGANSLFVGSTREDFVNGHTVVCLEYEAYESMAYKLLKQICSDIRKKWPNVRHIAIIHRIGKVSVKEPSIVVAVSSPHRKDSMEATNWCVEQVKATVPIWKKEIYDNNEYQWL